MLGAGYHAVAVDDRGRVGAGLGKGWGQGTQTLLSFLPEQHTDFIFSVWAEEHGFVGCLLLLALYYAVIISALGVGVNARDRFGALPGGGGDGHALLARLHQHGMVTGVMPVVGVTLPLMSYGGSSVLAVLFSIGLLNNVAMRRFVN